SGSQQLEKARFLPESARQPLVFNATVRRIATDDPCAIMPPRKPALQLIAPTDDKSAQEAVRRRFARLYEEYLAVEAEDAKDAGHLGFVAKWLVHATLPYVQPKGNPP